LSHVVPHRIVSVDTARQYLVLRWQVTCHCHLHRLNNLVRTNVNIYTPTYISDTVLSLLILSILMLGRENDAEAWDLNP